MPRDGTKNLKPQTTRTKDKQREVAIQGGIASGKVRRERRQFKDTLEILLKLPMKDGKVDNIEEIQSLLGVQGKNLTADQIILVQILSKATRGDLKAIEYLTNLIGENPIQRLQIDANIKHSIDDMDLEDMIAEAKKRKGGE